MNNEQPIKEEYVGDAISNLDEAFVLVESASPDDRKFHYLVASAIVHALLAVAQAIEENVSSELR